MPTRLPAFLLTTWLLAMLPGAGQAVMIRQVLAGGLRAARGTIVGNAAGLLLWSMAAAAGLSAVLPASPRAYTAIQIMGGIVLVALGVRTLTAARRAAPEPGEAGPVGAPAGAGRAGFRGGCATGLGTSLGNPKAGVFAVSVLPQFVTGTGPVFLSSALLGGVWALVNACWYLLFTWLVHRGRALVTRPAVSRGLALATGIALLALGVAVAAGA
ncbi:LysE family translocator [Streptomyces alanosinicus]|uniref:Threonine transporter RhtB n=1 Tax=Streptomyces alanosinicus TaxID=68171 RepID=A0A918YIE0_9ACTN|nr:LysE family translocator [Streptomyces alanosinicus]GHE05102.1 threonine transporter RhtB [Streptomyces alanosinicus]